MALDAAMLKSLARELSGQIVGMRIDKLYMPVRDEAVLQLRSQSGAKQLVICARAGCARLHLTEEQFDNPANPTAFCMLLRKHLVGGRIISVETPASERVVLFTIDAVNEMGDVVRLTLSVELMGRYSNIVLVSEQNRVIDALKRIDSDQSDLRQLLPGVRFTLPPPQDKLGFFETPSETLAERCTAQSKPLSSSILGCISGLSPAVCREISLRAVPGDPEADTLSDFDRARLASVLNEVRRAAEGDGEYYGIVSDSDGKPIEFSFIELTQYGGMKTERFDSASLLLEKYFGERDAAERLKTRSFGLRRQVNTLLERTRRRQSSREAELASTDKADIKKLYGELLTANLHAFVKGDEKVTVTNYYTGEPITIPLDRTKNPVQNSQKYYKDYRKLTTAADILTRLLDEGSQEIEYLETVLYEVDSAKTEGEFDAIRSELRSSGYLKSSKAPKGSKREKKLDDLIHYESDGFEIAAGKNNAANDRLTLKTAMKRDIWFHVKNGAGSHTVIAVNDEAVPDKVLEDAAMIAAYNSSQRFGELVAVDYTEIRNVKKASGQKTGMVIYKDYKTAFVTPDKARVEALEIKSRRRQTR